MSCPSRIRPMRPINETELRCELADGHAGSHSSVLHGYAHPGSTTTVTWLKGDRRAFSGDFNTCDQSTCILPAGHRGEHAS